MGNPALAVRLKMDNLRSLAFGSIGVNYAAIGTPLPFPARIIKIDNLTDVTLTFSDDGINDKFVLPAGGFLLVDSSSDQAHSAGAWWPAVGQSIFVKGAPGAGTVYVAIWFGFTGNNP